MYYSMSCSLFCTVFHMPTDQNKAVKSSAPWWLVMLCEWNLSVHHFLQQLHLNSSDHDIVVSTSLAVIKTEKRNRHLVEMLKSWWPTRSASHAQDKKNISDSETVRKNIAPHSVLHKAFTRPFFIQSMHKTQETQPEILYISKFINISNYGIAGFVNRLYHFIQAWCHDELAYFLLSVLLGLQIKHWYARGFLLVFVRVWSVTICQ